MCFGCQLRMSLMMLYDDLFWIWNSRYRNTVQKYFGKCVGPKFSVITFNLGNSSVNKQKTENEKEKNGHTLGLTSTNTKVQITLNNITDSTPERVLLKKGELYLSPRSWQVTHFPEITRKKRWQFKGKKWKMELVLKSSFKSSLISREKAHKKFIMLKSAPFNQL